MRQHASLLYSKPFLENDQAEQYFVIVISARLMLLEERLHRRGIQKTIHHGLFVEQNVLHLAVFFVTDSIIHDIYAESALLSAKNRIGQHFGANTLVQPLAGAVPDLKLLGQAFCVFDDFLIE